MIKAVIFDYDWVLVRYYFLPQNKLFGLAKELRSQGVKTAVLSNRKAPLNLLTKVYGNLRGFDPIIFSPIFGPSKPDPAAYQMALGKLNLETQECLFVDNRTDNIRAAGKLGMKTVLAKNTIQTIVDIRKVLGI